jgi:hypothetical protein
MAQLTVLEVTPEDSTWQNEFGTFRTYRLRLEGQDKIAHLNQKADTAPPVAGSVLDLDLTPHKRFADALQAKKIQAQGGGFSGGGGRGRSPEDDARRQKSIAMQASHKVAIEALKLAAEFGEGDDKYRPPSAGDVVAQIKLIASGLFQQIEEVSS